MTSTIPVFEDDVFARAAQLPVSYLEDCRAVVTIDAATRTWHFPEADYFRIRKKYRGYAVSESDQFREGQIISGCCDRADQY
jgi:hypothetical protein